MTRISDHLSINHDHSLDRAIDPIDFYVLQDAGLYSDQKIFASYWPL